MIHTYTPHRHTEESHMMIIEIIEKIYEYYVFNKYSINILPLKILKYLNCHSLNVSVYITAILPTVLELSEDSYFSR